MLPVPFCDVRYKILGPPAGHWKKVAHGKAGDLPNPCNPRFGGTLVKDPLPRQVHPRRTLETPEPVFHAGQACDYCRSTPKWQALRAGKEGGIRPPSP